MSDYDLNISKICDLESRLESKNKEIAELKRDRMPPELWTELVYKCGAILDKHIHGGMYSDSGKLLIVELGDILVKLNRENFGLFAADDWEERMGIDD